MDTLSPKQPNDGHWAAATACTTLPPVTGRLLNQLPGAAPPRTGGRPLQCRVARRLTLGQTSLSGLLLAVEVNGDKQQLEVVGVDSLAAKSRNPVLEGPVHKKVGELDAEPDE